MIRWLVVVTVALGLGCEGIGRAVVGTRPLPERMAADQCFAVDCDAILEPRGEPFEAPEELGAELARCPVRRDVVLAPDETGAIVVPELGCAHVLLEAETAFTLDLRARDLVGTQLTLRSIEPARVFLAGDLHHVSILVEGPIDVTMDAGALGLAAIELRSGPAQRPPSLTLDRVIATNLHVLAPSGIVRAHRSMLSRAEIVAEDLTLELSSITFASATADRATLLDAELLSVRLDVEVLVAAAGHMDQVDVARCGQVSLAVADVVRSSFAACTDPIFLDDVDVEASFLSGEVQGRGRFRRTGFSGASVSLEDSRLTLPALCGLARLDVASTAVECPTCAPVAPAEICGAPTVPQRFCPGYEVSPCPDGPRPSSEPLAPPAVAP